MKKKKLIWRLLPWILTLLILGGIAYVLILLYTQPEEVNKYEPSLETYGIKIPLAQKEQVLSEADLKKLEKDPEYIESVEIGEETYYLVTDPEIDVNLKLENEHLVFEMDEGTTHFTVTDKQTGAQWRSNPADNLDDIKKDGFSTTYAQWNALLSTVIVHSRSTGDEKPWSNFEYSIANGQNYQIEYKENDEGTEDDEIHVSYAVGKIEKEYVVPQAWTKERYDEYQKKLSGKAKKQVSTNYSKRTKKDIDKLLTGSDDDKQKAEELLALYPALGEEPAEGEPELILYILKEVKADMMQNIENYLADVGYTAEEKAEFDDQWIAAKKETDSELFNVTVVYRLEGNDLVAEVPYDKIRYRTNDRTNVTITGITLLPAFGACGLVDEAGNEVMGSTAGAKQQDGFIFVPEGGGGIIKFKDAKSVSDIYYADVYGWDYSILREEVINETRATFPVFGISKGDASFLCLMEGVNSFGSIRAETSKVSSNYNQASVKYHVLHCGKYNVNAKTQDDVFMYEKRIPDGSIVHRYRFLPTGNYAEMANYYGDYLRENELYAQSVASEDMPVSVEIIGAIDKTVVKAGVPVDSVVSTTTFDQAQDIMLDLQENGVKNLNVRMSGWSNGGITQKVLTKVKVLKELGGEKEMKELIAVAKENGINLYFDGITCFSYDSGITNGFVPSRNAARYATREQVKIYPYDVVCYIPAEWLDPFYLVQPQYAQEGSSKLIKKLEDVDAAGVAFRDIGYLLSGDLNSTNLTPREQVKEMNVQTLQQAKAANQLVMIKMGNDYAVPYADLITDMDLAGITYTVIDEQVPFYQIALHGMKDYTAKPINLVGEYQTELLRCAEYGSGLNFTFMADSAWVLQDTTHSGLFGANYDGWKEEAIKMICKYQEDMKGLNQQRIVSHETHDGGNVTVTGYADGTKVYVNYGSAVYELDDGVAIDARSYKVERGQ